MDLQINKILGTVKTALDSQNLFLAAEKAYQARSLVLTRGTDFETYLEMVCLEDKLIANWEAGR